MGYSKQDCINERSWTIVFNKLKKTLYMNATWRLDDKRFGLYLIKRNRIIGIGLICFEIILFSWGD